LHAHAFQWALYIISSFCFPRKTTEKASVSPIFQHMVHYLVQWKGKYLRVLVGMHLYNSQFKWLDLRRNITHGHNLVGSKCIFNMYVHFIKSFL